MRTLQRSLRACRRLGRTAKLVRRIASSPRPHTGGELAPDPFADAWPVIEGWLIAEPSVAAKALMDRLVAMVPEMYAGKAQLRTLQRRVKAWRSARVKEMVLGALRKADCSADRSLNRSRKLRMPRGPGASRPAGHGHVDDAPAAHRLRPWTTRRCAAALPTAAAFAHMPTAFDHEDEREETETTTSRRVTFLREATRVLIQIDARQPASWRRCEEVNYLPCFFVHDPL